MRVRNSDPQCHREIINFRFRVRHEWYTKISKLHQLHGMTFVQHTRYKTNIDVTMWTDIYTYKICKRIIEKKKKNVQPALENQNQKTLLVSCQKF